MLMEHLSDADSALGSRMRRRLLRPRRIEGASIMIFDDCISRSCKRVDASLDDWTGALMVDSKRY
jgi:hypothetical protein